MKCREFEGTTPNCEVSITIMAGKHTALPFQCSVCWLFLSAVVNSCSCLLVMKHFIKHPNTLKWLPREEVALLIDVSLSSARLAFE